MPQVSPAALQPFLLKGIYIIADILVDRTDAFQNDFTKHILPDIMRGAGATIAFIVTANIAILFPFKALAGGKVKLAAAIGTEQKSGKQSLPFRFYGAAFVFPQLLYPVPLSL